MKDRERAKQSLERLSSVLPDQIFINADKKFYSLGPGNNRGIHLMREWDILKIVHVAIEEHRRLSQIIICEKDTSNEPN